MVRGSEHSVISVLRNNSLFYLKPRSHVHLKGIQYFTLTFLCEQCNELIEKYAFQYDHIFNNGWWMPIESAVFI